MMSREFYRFRRQLRRSTLRLYLKPLTAWGLGTTCAASCVANDGSDCGAVVCRGEALVSADRRQVHQRDLE